MPYNSYNEAFSKFSHPHRRGFFLAILIMQLSGSPSEYRFKTYGWLTETLFGPKLTHVIFWGRNQSAISLASQLRRQKQYWLDWFSCCSTLLKIMQDEHVSQLALYQIELIRSDTSWSHLAETWWSGKNIRGSSQKEKRPAVNSTSSSCSFSMNTDIKGDCSSLRLHTHAVLPVPRRQLRGHAVPTALATCSAGPARHVLITMGAESSVRISCAIGFVLLCVCHMTDTHRDVQPHLAS